MPVGYNGCAIGDLAVAGYVRHPPAIGSAWKNGTPLDSSVANLVASNLAWLTYEGPRHLVASPGFGVLRTQNPQDPWNGFADAPTIGSGFVPTTSNEIPWSRRESIRLGPFLGICDQVITAAGANAGAVTLRKVRMRIAYTGSAGFLYVAMTTSRSPYTLAGGTYLDYQKVTLVSSPVDVTLFDGTVAPSTSVGSPQGAAAIPASSHDVRLSGPSIATGSPFVDVVPFWLWVGARITTVGGGSIVSISAWESR